MDQANTLKFDADHAEEFLAALGKNPKTTRVRAFYEKDDSRKTGDRGIKCDFSPERIQELINDGRGVYVVINEGGDTDKSITKANALFCEWDDMPKVRQKTEWQRLRLPEPTVQDDSGGRSIHNYWVFKEPIPPERFRSLQTRLAAHAASDSTLKNESRVMRLPGTFRGSADRSAVRMVSITNKKYDVEELDKCLPPLERVNKEWEASRRQFKRRSVAEVREALSKVPPRVPGSGTYPMYRNLLWGLIKAVEEAGSTKAEAISLMQQHSPQWVDIQQVADSGGEKITASTFWYHVQNHGYEATSTSKQSYQRNTGGKHCSLDDENSADKIYSYSKLVDLLLDATVAEQTDVAMPLRAELITTFRRTGSQVDQELFMRQMKRESGCKKKAPPTSLDLSAVTGMDYLIDGFIIENDQNLIWGPAGCGKTTVAIGLAKSVIYGEGFLDHEHHAKRGAVLFIASDSGPAPLKGSIQDFGLDDKPEFKEGPDKRFHVWASDQDQGMNAWSADLQGCMRLLHFVKEFGITLVIIDSCKAVLSGTDIEYTDNRGITSLMTFVKEVICPHTTVVWLNHDGAVSRGPGCPAGAKAWKEIPSIVHHLSVPLDEKTKKPVKTHRRWEVQKNRLGGTREFLYRCSDGDLLVNHGQTTHGNCLVQLVEFMSEEYARDGRTEWTKKALRDACHNHAAKTVDNTLTTAVRAKHPEICRRGRGKYALAPRILEVLKKARSQTGGTSSNPSTEQASSDFPSSSQPPESGSSPDTGDIPDHTHRDYVGNKADPMHRSRSAPSSSHPCSHLKGASDDPH